MRSVLPKVGWMIAGVLALFVISALAGVANGGPLDPAGVPGSTMLRLSELPPSWHQILPSNNGSGDGCNSRRFQCVMGGLAVLDNETGLVWQRTVAPDSSDLFATRLCERLELGGRYGWRLPTIQEMLTLADTSPDHLPDGHPFIGVLTPPDHVFWTVTVYSGGTGFSDALDFDAPASFSLVSGSGTARRWCVRGAGDAFDPRGDRTGDSAISACPPGVSGRATPPTANL